MSLNNQENLFSAGIFVLIMHVLFILLKCIHFFLLKKIQLIAIKAKLFQVKLLEIWHICLYYLLSLVTGSMYNVQTLYIVTIICQQLQVLRPTIYTHTFFNSIDAWYLSIKEKFMCTDIPCFTVKKQTLPHAILLLSRLASSILFCNIYNAFSYHAHGCN